MRRIQSILPMIPTRRTARVPLHWDCSVRRSTTYQHLSLHHISHLEDALPLMAVLGSCIPHRASADRTCRKPRTECYLDWNVVILSILGIYYINHLISLRRIFCTLPFSLSHSINREIGSK
ncbi:hypothetical protein BO82DRAFT_142636 [Aspergillus uvarum CBS 121591]|uniref:Uncharacterized protein n=1 Tax=Aspergillus uvarum CBS 121591 TaxID=1448315 RepID=A0A319CPC9_9EURO|nr:hypothetical protein BO82DRAFT_142636 [Aspergillus uvarum CBS 121591]PYH85941.1 hypothetical protein BO82DRAFT_142636 [Aspergillus uvarum CBS 121591]